jgi:hypothetical protein
VAYTEKSFGGARTTYMDQKADHLYTAGWGLTSDPDHLYYLYHINNYYHLGIPNDYAYYPGDYQQITVPYDGWQYNYTNIPSLQVPITRGDTTYNLDFSDYGKTWHKYDKVWVNPENYWSWGMMVSDSGDRALICARMAEMAIAELVCGVPVWTPNQFSAFYRNYSGAESPYANQSWNGVVDQKGFGFWGTRTFLDMHTANAVFGNGNMTIRWGFRQPTRCLNPIYAGWTWDWYTLNQCYDSATAIDPYIPSQDIGDLAMSWTLSTWDASMLGLARALVLDSFLYWNLCRFSIRLDELCRVLGEIARETLGASAVVGWISCLVAHRMKQKKDQLSLFNVHFTLSQCFINYLYSFVVRNTTGEKVE